MTDDHATDPATDAFVAHRNLLFTVAYEIFDGEHLAAQAQTVCVPYDLDHGRVRRLSADERSFIEHYLEVAA